MTSDAFSFGVSEFTTWPWPFERDIERYPRHAIDTVEITEFKLDAYGRARQLSSIAEAGLGVSSVQATVHALFPTKLQPEPLAPRDRARHIRTSIESIAPHVPAGTPFVVITGAAPNGDVHAVVHEACAAFQELAAVAEAHGVRIAFEPLHPSLMNVDSAICTLGDALDLVAAVDHPAFGVCVDTWNVWQTPDLDAAIARAGDRIFLVQISDWRTPRGYYDRTVPGDGRIPLGRIVQATRAAGYAGAYVLEIFSSESLPDSLWRADLDDVLDRSCAGFARIVDSLPRAAS
ncbi:MAG: sugar phosphate isomerase/epimerase family protein [Candidatus Velthaea sp.]